MCSKEILDYINRIWHLAHSLSRKLQIYLIKSCEKYRNILKNTKYNRAIEVNGIVPLAAK